MKQWTSIEELQSWLDECKCIADFCRKLEIVPRGDNYRIVKELIQEHNLSTKHFIGSKKYQVKQQGKIKPLSEILESGIYTNTTKLKDRLFRWGIKERKCECCGNTEWMGIELPLEIHHINGDHKNNKLENLQILCPNCHSLTSNYRGKNIEVKRSNINPESIKETIEKLKIKEQERQKEIELNRHVPKTQIVRTKKSPKYCEICGKEITNKNNTKYCSLECLNKSLRKFDYQKEVLLEQSKQVRSLIQLANLYDITDNAMKKQLKRLGIYEECKKNFLPITKSILQYDLDGNFIKEWSSGLEASNELGFQKSDIQSCCTGKRKTTHSYIFKYK